MLKDGFGLEVATEQPSVITAIDAFSGAFQGQRQGVVGIFQTAKSDPACVLTQVLSAVMFLYTLNAGVPMAGRCAIWPQRTASVGNKWARVRLVCGD